MKHHSFATALRAVGPLPRSFYLKLANAAESTDDRTLAVGLLDIGLEYIPGDRAMLRRRDLLLKAPKATNTKGMSGPRAPESGNASDVAPAPSATLIVKTGAARSRVLIDGAQFGTTDDSGMVKMSVEPGIRDVTIRRDGFVDERSTVDLIAGRIATVTAAFYGQPSILEVVTFRGARIEVDGRAIPGSSTRVLPGSHMVTVSAPGFVTTTQSVIVASGRHQKISVPLLKASEASQSVSDNEPGVASAPLPEPRTDVPSLYKAPENESAEEGAFRESVEADVAQAVQRWASTIMGGGELRLAVKHDFRLIRIHRLFNGTLRITNRGIVFDAHQYPSDSFAIDWADVKDVKENGLNKRDRAVVAMELEVVRTKDGRRDTRTYKFVSGRGWIDHEQDVKCNDCVPLMPAVVTLVQTIRGRVASGAAKSGQAPVILNGTFRGAGSDSSGSGEMIWRLAQSAGSISGTVVATTTRGLVGFSGTVSGVMSGTTLSFTVVAQTQSGNLSNGCTVTIQGSANGVTNETIKGTYTGTSTCTKPFKNGRLRLRKQ